MKKVLLIAATLGLILVTAFFYYRTQQFDRIRERGRHFYNSGVMSRALPFLEAAHGIRPHDGETLRMLDGVYEALGFDGKRRGLREDHPEIFDGEKGELDAPKQPEPPQPESAGTAVVTQDKPPIFAPPVQPSVTPPPIRQPMSSEPAARPAPQPVNDVQPLQPADSAQSSTDARDRVRKLTWVGQYDQADREYRILEREAGPGSAVAVERAAKADLYAGRDLAAEKKYDEWLLMEPDSIEALAGLSEIYERTGRKSEALKVSRRIEGIIGDQPWIAGRIRRLERETQRWVVETGIRYFEADSGSRVSDVRKESIYTGIRRGTALGPAFYAAEEGQRLFFSDHNPVDRRMSVAEAAWTLPNAVDLQAAYTYSDYSDSLPDTHDGSVRAAFKGCDGFTPSVFYSREDVIENSSTLLNRMHLNRTGLSLEERPVRRMSLIQRFERAVYSDGNIRRDFVSEAVLHVLEGPRQLDLFHRYQTYGYEESTGLYFSPDDFHVNEGGFEWRQYPEAVVAGQDPDDYYAFRYTVNFDVHQQVGHRIAWRGQWRFSPDWAVRAEVWNHIYEHEKIYGETGATVSMNYAFGR